MSNNSKGSPEGLDNSKELTDPNEFGSNLSNNIDPETLEVIRYVGQAVYNNEKPPKKDAFYEEREAYEAIKDLPFLKKITPSALELVISSRPQNEGVSASEHKSQLEKDLAHFRRCAVWYQNQDSGIIDASEKNRRTYNILFSIGKLSSVPVLLSGAVETVTSVLSSNVVGDLQGLIGITLSIGLYKLSHLAQRKHRSIIKATRDKDLKDNDEDRKKFAEKILGESQHYNEDGSVKYDDLKM